MQNISDISTRDKSGDVLDGVYSGIVMESATVAIRFTIILSEFLFLFSGFLLLIYILYNTKIIIGI